MVLIENRLDRIENKLDRYSEMSVRAIECLEQHINNREIHLTSDDIQKRLSGKAQYLLVTVVTTVITSCVFILGKVFGVI